MRDRIRQWQPNLRMLFITRIVLWRYRAGLPGFELPEAMQPAQQEFDNRLAAALDGMADRMDGKASTRIDDLTTCLYPARTSGMEGCTETTTSHATDAVLSPSLAQNCRLGRLRGKGHLKVSLLAVIGGSLYPIDFDAAGNGAPGPQTGRTSVRTRCRRMTCPVSIWTKSRQIQLLDIPP